MVNGQSSLIYRDSSQDRTEELSRKERGFKKASRLVWLLTYVALLGTNRDLILLNINTPTFVHYKTMIFFPETS